MKMTSTMLSIPPYLSTSWKNITSLHVREEEGLLILIVFLQNDVQVEVPGLDNKEIEEIFEAHARSIEEHTPTKIHPPFEGPFTFSLPIKDGLVDPLAVQHNPEQANLPLLPPEILKKIAMIARAFGIEDTSSMPKAEPHCNCMYCQIARSLHSGESPSEQIEEVSDEDLKFRNWETKETSDNLYTVTNLLDPNEQYSVFLGTPLGCTCGSKNCEHIRAVLNS